MSNLSPPKFFLRFFQWFCDPDLHPFVEGDLYELYRERVAEMGENKADRRFALDVLLLFRPGMIRSFRLFDNLLNQHAMLKSYFKIGFRNLSKHRFFSLINLGGMTIAMTCFILITLYIQYEFSYDRQHEKADRIYRVAQLQVGNELMGSDRFTFASLPIVPTLREEFPEIEAATTLTVQQTRVSRREETFYEEVLYADEQLFDVFTYPLVEGVGTEALKDPNAVILTESMAVKYFGQDNPIGKTLLFREDRPMTVRGIVEDVPDNQHFSFGLITSVKNYPWYEEGVGRWNSNNYHAYIVLPPDYDYAQLDKKLPEMDHYFEADYASFPFQPTLFLQPLTAIHLYSHTNGEMKANGDIRYIYFSAAIALIILLLASINYMNLTNARAGQRVREVGVRKVLGAGRKHLLGQLMTESFIITLGSFMLGAGLAYLLIPAFSQLLDQSISLLPTNDRLLPAGLLLLGVVLSSLAGLYPAFLSAGVHPVQALKGYFFKHRKDGTFLRNALVVGQFTAAIVLAISSVVIYQQLRFVQNKKLGFSRDQILYVPYRDLNLYDQASAIRSELLKHPRIRQVSIANNLPVDLTSDNLVNRWEGNTDGRELSIYRNRVDYYFLDLYEIELVEGRNFSPEFPSDTRDRYLLNETAVKTLGWESAVGKSFKDGEVIGVVKDFHFHKLDQTIKPLFLTMPDPDYSYWGFFAMKVGSENMQETISYVQETLKRFVPQLIFEHGFVDENYQRLYDAEKRFGHVFNIFTLIALLIACMGLLGLVTHNVLQRTKEIGIRKILGSSIAGIVQLISGDFIRLVLIAAFIAVPVSWWGMHHWLEHFAYRIDLDWWVFVAVGILAIGLAFLTVSTQAVRAAAANPVDSLKAE